MDNWQAMAVGTLIAMFIVTFVLSLRIAENENEIEVLEARVDLMGQALYQLREKGYLERGWVPEGEYNEDWWNRWR